MQHKFSNVITFGFAFLFHQIHSTNIQQKQSPIQSSHAKPAKLQINPASKVTPNSNTSRSSSPKDYQAINRMFALTLKNLVIYFVNIVDYKDLCKEPPAKGPSTSEADRQESGSAVLQIFSKILVNKYSDQQESQLITLEDIKRYKATNFEGFPEYFSHEDWKVTFFHNEEINQILRAQMSPQMIQELFLTRRQTYSKGISEMNTRSEKTKEDIQKRIHGDTFERVSQLSELAYEQKVNSRLQIFVQNIRQRQQHKSLRAALFLNRGLWTNYGPRYLRATSQGYCGLGVKAFLKERPHNGFKFIKNPDLERKLFRHVDPDIRGSLAAEDTTDEGQNGQFRFVESRLEARIVAENKSLYIEHIKSSCQGQREGQREIVQADCALMKAFHQAKGTLILTSEDLIFAYLDPLKEQP